MENEDIPEKGCDGKKEEAGKRLSFQFQRYSGAQGKVRQK